MTPEERMDAALLGSLPTIAVPRYSAFVELETPGQRLLMTANGPMLEVRRKWLYARAYCGEMDRSLRLPYGMLTEKVASVMDGKKHQALLEAFVEEARRALPNEVGGAVIWNESTDELRLVVCRSNEATPGFLKYELPRVESNEHLVIDVHSHGSGPAFFSALDDADDCAATKFAFVVGQVERSSVSVAARACLMGVMFGLTQYTLPVEPATA